MSLRKDPVTIDELLEFIREQELPGDMPVWVGMATVGHAYEFHANKDKESNPYFYGLFICET